MKSKRQYLILALSGLPFMVWLGLLAAPYWGTLWTVMDGLSQAIKTPFQIHIGSNSLAAVLLFSGLWCVGCLYGAVCVRNTRYGEEHGSATWGNPAQICKELSVRTFEENRLFTQNMRISYAFFKHRRNVNTLVVGGSGAQKSRGYAIPNVLQNNCSNIILDPKGEILRGCGHLLEAEGTVVKVLDLIDMEKSLHYNPFHYLRNENDVQTMVTTIFSATTPPNSQTGDPFWDQSAQSLLMAFCFYLWLEAPPEEQNFAMVMELLHCTKQDDNGQCIADTLFDELAQRDPNHIALHYYNEYRGGPQKTTSSIQMVLSAHLNKFNLPALAKMTQDDELDLRSIGEKKTALFLRLSDSDKSFNFIPSMLYIQVIQQLFDSADLDHGGSLPVHVHLLMDEFANVALPGEFESYLSTMRSRNISASIILQNIAQLRFRFEKQWESIIGNCDELLYLGGNEQSTHEYVSKALGDETIWVRSNSLSRGSHGSYSRNDSTSARKLMTPEEVRKLPNEKAILFVRGYSPVLDRKFDLMSHPKIRQTAFGGREAYIHARPDSHAGGWESDTYQILSPEDLDEI